MLKSVSSQASPGRKKWMFDGSRSDNLEYQLAASSILNGLKSAWKLPIGYLKFWLQCKILLSFNNDLENWSVCVNFKVKMHFADNGPNYDTYKWTWYVAAGRSPVIAAKINQSVLSLKNRHFLGNGCIFHIALKHKEM